MTWSKSVNFIQLDFLLDSRSSLSLFKLLVTWRLFHSPHFFTNGESVVRIDWAKVVRLELSWECTFTKVVFRLDSSPSRSSRILTCFESHTDLFQVVFRLDSSRFATWSKTIWIRSKNHLYEVGKPAWLSPKKTLIKTCSDLDQVAFPTPTSESRF